MPRPKRAKEDEQLIDRILDDKRSEQEIDEWIQSLEDIRELPELDGDRAET